MTGKITLITAPDFFENFNPSILFVNLSEKDQDTISYYLIGLDLKENYNFYVFNNEDNVAWLLYALNRCDATFIDLDNTGVVVNSLAGYIAGKSNVLYKTSDENLAAIFNHINQNRITNIVQFLERVFSDKTN